MVHHLIVLPILKALTPHVHKHAAKAIVPHIVKHTAHHTARMTVTPWLNNTHVQKHTSKFMISRIWMLLFGK